jgi:hypothetical protein
MNTREQGVIHQAVVFFDGGQLVKEMLQVEFEAVLDQVVGLPEFAGQEVCACFLRINQRLQIVGAVFFLADFDDRGYVNRSWNVPLQHLLDNAGRGPDLGGGRIRLACRSQCSVPWHARQLWDPVLEGEHNSLRQMQQAVKRNRLGLTVDVPELRYDEISHPPVLETRANSEQVAAAVQAAQESERQVVERVNRRLQQEYRNKVASLQGEHQLQLATLKSSLQEQVDQVHQRYQIQVGQFKEALLSTKQLFKDEKRRTLQLKEKLSLQLDEFQRVREELQQNSSQERDQGAAKLQQAQQQFEVELKARVEQASTELKEMLEMREVELFYREEQLGTLREEIARLRQERERLITKSGDGVLQHLVENGVAFVAYQPGAEAMSIPIAELPRYLDSPLAYVAEKCMVTIDQYRQWLSHHELPVCGAAQADGSICGEPIDKIERPSQFIAGVNDRCRQHAEHYSELAAVAAPQAGGH